MHLNDTGDTCRTPQKPAAFSYDMTLPAAPSFFPPSELRTASGQSLLGNVQHVPAPRFRCTWHAPATLINEQRMHERRHTWQAPHRALYGAACRAPSNDAPAAALLHPALQLITKPRTAPVSADTCARRSTRTGRTWNLAHAPPELAASVAVVVSSTSSDCRS